MKECVICGRPNSEEHHVIYRSECRALIKCKKNSVYLCPVHHREKFGVHGKCGKELNKKLKLEFQNWLEETFNKEFYSIEEIKDKLGISTNAIKSLSKLIRQKNSVFGREDIIIACMGGKRVL
ncbi:hypothetical protein [Clostridium botulinum]|uniref:hypothetical protein n=1 Tax=Clostridium botulinum TaxID=1491 RepID=UPI000A175774|nr:hypothetical protein [Clostridium botulinum]OSA81328.1 hypothetical protein B2H89_03550 [Clostridium botulinum]